MWTIAVLPRCLCPPRPRRRGRRHHHRGRRHYGLRDVFFMGGALRNPRVLYGEQKQIMGKQ